MKNSSLFSLASVFAVLILVSLACNFSTANLSSLTTSKDKNGNNETSAFEAGDTLYAKAQVSNNPGKVKVKLYLVADNVKKLKAGETLKGSEVTLDIEGDQSANYSVPVSAGFPPGTYKLNAEMMNESGEKKDSKSTTVTITE